MTFSKATLTWLEKLEKNNDRDWFTAHKKEFEKATIQPMLAFIRELEAPLKGISGHYTAVAKKAGGSLMRIYRDTRFSKDKSPYNPYLRARFLHEESPKSGPGFYIHIGTDKVALGSGVWHPDKEPLAAIREAIDKKQGAWRKVIEAKAFEKTYGALEGESLKRPPRGYAKDHPLIEDIKRKDFAAFCELPKEAIVEKDFLQRVVAAYKDGAGLVRFLCDAVGLSF